MLVQSVKLNRPKALNALCKPLFVELGKAVRDFDADDSISAIIITGNEKAFAAGADIKEMQNNTYSTNQKGGFLKEWEDVSNCGKPVIAAVNGFAAKFGQPEINIGTIPGAGGTQRLPRYVGKSKAMEIVLTGNFIDAHDAEKMGLVSKVFPVEKLLEETIKLAERIGTHSPLIVKMVKQAVNQAYETTLKSGLQFEKSVFYGTFATLAERIGTHSPLIVKMAKKAVNQALGSQLTRLAAEPSLQFEKHVFNS
ncbi:Enoyl-CoA hydratase, partial [Operophtera brumata]